MDQDNEIDDSAFKLLIIGNSDVGKSCILLRFCDGEFVQNPGTTIGVDFRFSSIELDGEEAKLQIWDTAGQERFRTITSTYYRNADGVMVVYDVTNQSSFDQVKNWFREISSNAPQNVATILVGNKIDLESQRSISTKQGSNLANSLHSPFIEVSAKSGENILEAFRLAAKETKKKTENIKVPKEKNIVQFRKTNQKKSCC
ncbi:ras and ef-hand domain-containing protein [Anaeramoeba ignava]|uniref:Ras and ef-hand domain-containing protein n=1 Tax=Anaeramoeba ignava TaxID=1746090 RepID=A0A9Q0L9H3_ANAIG|nr:ras and ef-hand domain-containing protein [Anaeramoeba ignava]